MPLYTASLEERRNALAVFLALFHIIVITCEQLSLHGSHRDTMSQASSLLKAVDFEILIALLVTQRIQAYTEGVTLKLQAKAADLTGFIGDVPHVTNCIDNT